MKRIRTKRPALFTPAVLPAEGESGRELPDANVGGRFLLLGKYGSASIAATSTDFTAFHIALTILDSTPVLATILGRSVGSVVAFLLHRNWVFSHSKNRDGNVLRMKYVLGIFIGLGLNAAGVWLLNGTGGMEPWPARILTATSVWFFSFLFNKTIVFK